MLLDIDDLGVVGIVVDDWDITKEFKPKTITTDYTSWITYISRRPVPANIPITDPYYWKPILRLDKQIAFNYENFKEEVRRELKAMNDKIDKYIQIVEPVAILATQCGSNENVAPTLKLFTDSINQIWKEIRNMKGENDDGIIVKVTPDYFISEDTAKVNISVSANDSVIEKLQIYINDVPVWDKPLENIQRYNYIATMSETSEVRVEAQILGVLYQDTKFVHKYYPFFIGSGTDWEDIVNEKYARDLHNGKLRGSYNINIENDGDYMFIIIPSSREQEIVRFDMNGYEIPIEVLNNTKYTIYKSANQYRRGLFNIDISTNCECDNCE
jgi:hypothetical protein